ncbi:MAG: hypothetical protein IPN17_25775 [Deltaproteobacteria bacterium]|nr:hypothetical protein [Deltaproteobacteria bacterium]
MRPRLVRATQTAVTKASSTRPIRASERGARRTTGGTPGMAKSSAGPMESHGIAARYQTGARRSEGGWRSWRRSSCQALAM